ncbi:hypothetical protein [Pandoravirus japonicus]|uniref:Uncharacterized protein n=1 Tax=Pandoravirus japonicus TaxID=2823154 RepID=A0A811BTH8_9VIRU|nr:hypothetical protein [Pandoravirus japonicus]
MSVWPFVFRYVHFNIFFFRKNGDYFFQCNRLCPCQHGDRPRKVCIGPPGSRTIATQEPTQETRLACSFVTPR